MFTGTWSDLRDAIRKLAADVECTEDGGNEYGIFYRVEGMLLGTAGARPVALIWMRRAVDNTFHFVTLKPHRK